MKKINISALIIVLILVAFLVGYGSRKGISINPFGAARAKQVAQKAVDFINENILGASEGDEERAILISASEEYGLYAFKMTIGGMEYYSYVTKDGKMIFPEPGIMTEEEEGEGGKALTCEDLKKEEEPELEAFIASQCPFGTQMLRIVNEIVKNIPELDNYINIRYMGDIQDGKITAMHGQEEAEENLRQICIREEQKDKYWQYIDCYLKEGLAEECLVSASISQSSLDQCTQDESKGLKYAQNDFDAQDEYQVSGSPTLILNKENVSEFDFGGRSAEAVKTVICCGFNNKPDFCSEQLIEEQAAAGIAPSYSEGPSGGNESCD